MNFDDTYKRSYSHGLEAIYALESVDVRSIRKLVVEVEKKEVHSIAPPLPFSSQLELDLGVGFRHWINTSVEKEPIQALNLNRLAEKWLLEMGKKRIGDLLSCDLRLTAFSKGGQGHLDEIRGKLSAFLEHKELKQTQRINFKSWLSALCPPEQRLNLFLYLEKKGLEQLVTLNNAEGAEWRRLTQDHKETGSDAGHKFLKQLKPHMELFFQEISAAFLRGWVAGRQGIATENEIVERLEQRTLDPEALPMLLKFFSSLNLNCISLEKIEDRLYAAHPYQVKNYQQVMTCACSYFCHPNQHYVLSHLISLIEREQARSWQGFEEGFVEKCLRYSHLFYVWKNKAGERLIKTRLAPLHPGTSAI